MLIVFAFSFSPSSPQPGGDLNMKRAFLKEAAVMGQFRHKNIIKLIGICSGTESKLKVQSCNTVTGSPKP